MSQPSTGALLKKKRFLPYFITQFFGAFNDNIFKNVLLLLVAFASVDALPVSSNLFINLAAGLFILPFFLFSATAGVLADKYEKSWFIRRVKLAEIVIMTLGAIGFITQSYFILLLLLFLMGTQSAFFGPVKYALLPQHLKREELVGGNALVETGTFVAILLGTLGAGVIASTENAPTVAAVCVVVFAVCGYLACRFIPKADAVAPETKFAWRPYSQTKDTLKIAKQDKKVHHAILSISWFWFLGACYLTQFPNFTKLHLLGNESAVSFLLALFSIGIAVGSMACDRISKHQLNMGIVPFGSLGISLFGLLLAVSVPEGLTPSESFIDFVTTPALWPVFISLLMLGISGGLFIVPLYTLMQTQAKPEQRARIIAANNIYNAIFMVGSAVLGIVCLSVLELSITQLFILLAVLNIYAVVESYLQSPMYMGAKFLKHFTRTLYRINLKNFHHIPKEGGALLICNHVSFMDAPLLIGALPRHVRFVMEEEYATWPPIKRMIENAGVIPIDAKNTRSVRRAFIAVEKALAAGDVVCIFPEGRLTSDGEMNDFMRGIELILRRSPVPVVPLALKGMWGSYFSRYKGSACKGLPDRFRAKVEIEAGEPVCGHSANNQIMQEKVAALRGDFR
ncbi:MFS transporter [Vibrio sp. SCSIO 43136]|uniref:MFS transporter n=1 Tax=Vibrio sp. SCSIO 43136 TaxID=2819101 RepID=UPI0020762F70|nr:MFS transporter [Vibrio sp. SCSIO 43136]USD64454.1 MFS transporter [Vibrio sp. SCSIO 43136]